MYQAYAFVGDAAGAIFLGGIVWAVLRRYVQRPYRIRIKTKPEHAVILGVFALIGVSGFVTEMFRIAAEGTPDVREVELHRLPAGHAGRRGQRHHASTAGTRSCGSPTWWPSSPSS